MEFGDNAFGSFHFVCLDVQHNNYCSDSLDFFTQSNIPIARSCKMIRIWFQEFNKFFTIAREDKIYAIKVRHDIKRALWWKSAKYTIDGSS